MYRYISLLAAEAVDAAGVLATRGIWRQTDIPERGRATVGTPVRIWTTTMSDAIATQISRRPSPRGVRPPTAAPSGVDRAHASGRSDRIFAANVSARSAAPRHGGRGAPLDVWSQLARDGRGGPFSRAAATVSPY